MGTKRQPLICLLLHKPETVGTKAEMIENAGAHRGLRRLNPAVAGELCRDYVPTNKPETEAFKTGEGLNASRIQDEAKAPAALNAVQTKFLASGRSLC